MSERPHKKLKLWAKTIDLIEDIYKVSSSFPKDELYCLVSQMRRAAVSIASNIAEGSARKGLHEKIQFYYISRSSLSELDAQLEIALRLKYTDSTNFKNLQDKLDEISRMLSGLIQSCGNKTSSSINSIS